MRPFLVQHRSRLPVGEAWRRLTDWERHGAHVPLTRILVTTPQPTGVGTRFVARTRLGPVAVDDVMEVVRWQPPSDGAPGLCRLQKRGSAVTGWAELEVGAHDTGSWVVWREALHVTGLPRWCDTLTNRLGHRVFGRVVRGLLNE